MSLRSATRILALTIVALAVTACGGGAASVAVDPTASPPSTPASTVATPTPTTTTALAWTVTDKSKVTVRVREQLASLNFPSDAVLVATGAKGAFQVNDDGSFAPGSQISFDVSSLTSDQSQRDGFVKMTVLNTRQFPTATFVPTKATGLVLPLAANGRSTFTLTGKLTIHGTEKEVTFSVDATRSGGELTATATLAPTVKFGDFGMPQPAAPGRVLSVVDEIKLTVDLVATGPKG
jgi:polyisoprenoid-binding protein YceI